MTNDTIKSRIAGLADQTQIISGIAIGEGDVTRGLSEDLKIWPEDELRPAAETLEGGDVKALHSEAAVGEVVDAGYVDGKGVVYEARIEDPEIYKGVQNGRYTVSVEASHADGGTVETEQGDAMRAANVRLSDLAVVQRGAAPSANAQPGEAAALALSPGEISAALDEDPASTEGDASDIDISDSTETALENKRDEHNEDAPESKQVTKSMLKKVYRRGAGAWFSSNKGATQNQWAMARVNEFIKDLRNDNALNHGNDNDLAPDGYNPPESEQSAALVEVNGTEIDLEAPPRVKNAIEAALDAKDEYSDDLGDCGTGVGEDMGRTILDDDLSPEIITNGGDIAQYGPSTYLDGHAEDKPSTEDPPTDWSREDWLGMNDGGDPRCGPVQYAMWGHYLDWFDGKKAEVEEAMSDESESNADDDTLDVRIPMPSEDVQLLYPDKSTAEEAADAMGLGSEAHPHTLDGSEMFMPGESHSAFTDAVGGMGAGMAGLAPVAVLAEMQNVGPISFQGTRRGDLDESELPNTEDGREGHYLNPGETEDESSYPLVDADGYLRRGNLNSAWNMRGQGDLGMPRDSAERLMLNLGLIFGPPDSEANPLPEDAYEGRETGTPFAEEAADGDVDGSDYPEATATAALAEITADLSAAYSDDPVKPGEVAAATDDESMNRNKTPETATLGSHLADEMSTHMEKAMMDSEMSRADLMSDMAEKADMSMSNMRKIARGDVNCPGVDAMEAMSDILEVDMGMLVDAANEDGCEYASLPYHSDDESEQMSQVTELKAELSDKVSRIEELEDEVETLRSERDEVAREYAEALAETDTVLDADDYLDRFSVAELADKFSETDGAELAEAEPTTRSGSNAVGDDAESESLAGGDKERKNEIEARLSELEDKDGLMAEKEAERLEDELAELTE